VPLIAAVFPRAGGAAQIEGSHGRDSGCIDGDLSVVCTGAPRFVDSGVAETARERGSAMAWLELYRARGADAPARVHGTFAVAVFDSRMRAGLLAVDRFAVESLCFSLAEDRIALASRADGVPGAARDLDPQALYDYLYFHVIPAPRTAYRGVRRLCGGQRLSFDPQGMRVDQWWMPRFDEARQEPVAALRDEFRTRLRNAVRHASGSGALGCFLSGGTDSSTVAGMLGELEGRPAKTYSIGFDAAGYDEMAYARIAARHFHTDHHEYYVTPRDLEDVIPRLAAHFDQPFGNSSAAPAYCCARLAHDDGVDALLAGDGGDELFGGNTRYATQRVLDAYRMLPRALRTGAEAVAPLVARVPLVRKAASYVEQASVEMPDRLQRYNLLARIGVDAMLEPDFSAQVEQGEPLRQQREIYAACEARSLVNRMLAFDWKFTLADSDLPKVVGATGAAGVAVAFPMLDDELVDFSLRLAPELKLRRLTLRYFFKQALEGFLPDAIIAKKKHGFGLPFGVWITQPGPLRDLAIDSLTAIKRRHFVRPAFVDELVARLLPQHPGYYGELVWILMMLEQWLRLDRVTTGARDPAAACRSTGSS
jgi:asparagine synthase (glutamine-hydrolysing)